MLNSLVKLKIKNIIQHIFAFHWYISLKDFWYLSLSLAPIFQEIGARGIIKRSYPNYPNKISATSKWWDDKKWVSEVAKLWQYFRQLFVVQFSKQSICFIVIPIVGHWSYSCWANVCIFCLFACLFVCLFFSCLFVALFMFSQNICVLVIYIFSAFLCVW